MLKPKGNAWTRGKLEKTLAGAGVLALLGLSGCGDIPNMNRPGVATDFGPPTGKPVRIPVYPFSEKAKRVFHIGSPLELGPDAKPLPLPPVDSQAYVVLGPVREHLCRLRYYLMAAPTDFTVDRHPGLQKKAMEKALKESSADALIRIHNKNASDGGLVFQSVKSCVDLTATAIRWR